MSGIEELKKLIEKDGKLTAELQKKFANLGNDYIAIDEYKKLEADVVKNASERAATEVKFNAELTEVKKLAEEAALKAGRRVVGDDAPESEAQILHKSAFIEMFRKRKDNDVIKTLKDAEQKAVETGTPGSGGFAVPEEIARNINTKVEDVSVMLALVNVVTVGTSDYKELIDKGGMGFGWVGETDARAVTGTPQIYEVTPAGGTIYAYPEATEESLDDIFFDVAAWLQSAALTAFANGKDVAIISGDGTNKPLGMLGTAPVATADGARADKIYQFLATGAAADFGADAWKNIVDLIYLPKAKYRQNASFLMNSLSTAKVRVLKDGNGRPLWQDNQIVGQAPMLEGYAVNAVESMPDFAANSHPISFGDYKAGYTWVNRHGTRITEDAITKPGYLKWNVRQRVAGAPTNDDAVKFLKCAV